MITDFNPHDPDEKRQLHPKADDKNFVEIQRGHKVLRCGAKKKGGRTCRALAGRGTDHKGYGRCKHCGGCSTGPKTAEAKAKVSQNARKHGLYAAHLSPAEQIVYREIQQQRLYSLEDEVTLLKTKLVGYLRHTAEVEQAEGPDGLRRTRRRGEHFIQYEMGSADDPHVLQIVEQIRRLVATMNTADSDDPEKLVDQVNAELRAASKGRIAISWSGPAQHYIPANPTKNEE